MRTRLLAMASTALLAIALAGCTATPPTSTDTGTVSAAPVAVKTPPPPATPTPTPSAAPTGCDLSGWVWVGMASPDVTKEIVDQGSRELAAGTVGRDGDGRIVTYTVAAGDASNAIGARLCLRDPGTLSTINHTRTIHPGQVLRLYRDPALPEVQYYGPLEAPGGFQQIPYQETLENMGVAADAGDVAAVRRMWTETLSGMFYNDQLVADIQKHVDAGDPEVLRQLFS